MTRDLAETARLLREPFPSASIGKLPKGGQLLDFVGHAAVTERLLAVDPEWTWEPLAFDEVGLPRYDAKGGLWIRLTIGGVTRLGYGDGPDPKQRIGDAIRNAAMRFGVALDLWTKEDLVAFAHVDHLTQQHADPEPAERPVTRSDHADGGEWTTPTGRSVPAPPRIDARPATGPQLTKLGAMFTDMGIKDREQRLAVVRGIIPARDITSAKDLTRDEIQRVFAALEDSVDLSQTPVDVPLATVDGWNAATAEAAARAEDGAA